MDQYLDAKIIVFIQGQIQEVICGFYFSKIPIAHLAADTEFLHGEVRHLPQHVDLGAPPDKRHIRALQHDVRLA